LSNVFSTSTLSCFSSSVDGSFRVVTPQNDSAPSPLHFEPRKLILCSRCRELHSHAEGYMLAVKVQRCKAPRSNEHQKRARAAKRMMH